jgi:dTDP-4-dehydrorhamnose reductase
LRILVTGARGMLGTDLVPELARVHAVTATDIDDLDVRDGDQVRAAVARLRPELIVHLAALTDVDVCERTPDDTFRTNAIGTQLVALAARRAGAALLYMSSLSVFDGAKPEPYTEFDATGPLNVYSQAKLAGEEAIREMVPRHYIVRSTGLFGGGPRDKKFVRKILDRAQAGGPVPAIDDIYTSPTSTLDLSRALAWLIGTELYGTTHLVNRGYCTRYEYARAILEAAGLGTDCLVPVHADAFPLVAPRPRMEAAVNYRLQLLGQDPMRPWKTALVEYVCTLARLPSRSYEG